MRTKGAPSDQPDDEQISRPAQNGAGRAFRALRHRNFRLFFIGQFISLIGTWVQGVAQGWLVYTLAHSAFLLGVVNATQNLPYVALGLFGGVVADRTHKRNLLVGTQSAQMVLAFILAALTGLKLITVGQIMVVAFCLGIVNSFDLPCRQAFFVELVGREDLVNAIALNSAMFNGARILGPAAAGALVGIIGIAGCFGINGFSFIAVIIGLLMMRVPRPVPSDDRPAPLAEIREGLRYIRREKSVLLVICLVAVPNLCAVPYGTLMPVFAKDVLGGGAREFGLLMAAVGMGALVGAWALSMWAGPHNQAEFLFGGLLGLSSALIAFCASRTLLLSMAMLVLVGWAHMTTMSTASSLVQGYVADRLRGRVMSVYSLSFMGIAPLGALLLGAAAHRFGAPPAETAGAVVTGVFGVCMFATGGMKRLGAMAQAAHR